jgi:hypothetical protein
MTSVLPDRGPSATAPGRPGRRWRRRVLIGLELLTGTTAVAGGLLLAAAPDGSLMRADPVALAGSPFADWRLPGVLLATLVGGGYLVTGSWQWRDGPWARALSMVAGAGLVVFEAFELAWIGFQPLQVVCAVAGTAVLVLAATDGRPAPTDRAQP